jgi:chromosomal replication initiator protein
VDLPAHQLWQAALSELQLTLSRSSFDNWIRPARLVEVGSREATLSADSPQVATTLRNRFADDIGRVLSDLVGRPIDIVVTTEPAASLDFDTPAQRALEPAPRQLTLTTNSGLNPRYIFDTYIVGGSNRFAHAASLAVADKPGEQYNPLYIWGGVGLGKTHLLHAIGHRALENNPDLVLTYVSSETFTNEVIASIRSQRMEEFRERYRGVDLLMIDDIQFIAGKESTQEEFFHTFNALYQSGKQVIISSDRPPKSIAALEDRLRSRFEGGLIADVQLPDYEMRTAILRTKADELGVSLPDDLIEYVAHRDQTNIRELEGALNKILMMAQLYNRKLDVSLAMEALTDASFAQRRASTTATDVLKAVCAEFAIAEKDLLGRQRKREIVRPRHVAMYLLREQTESSLVEIGRTMGGRDHTTVLHGIEKIERELETDPQLRSRIISIQEALLTGRT